MNKHQWSTAVVSCKLGPWPGLKSGYRPCFIRVSLLPLRFPLSLNANSFQLKLIWKKRTTQLFRVLVSKQITRDYINWYASCTICDILACLFSTCYQGQRPAYKLWLEKVFLDHHSIKVKDLYRDDLSDLKTPIPFFKDVAENNTERWDWVGLISYSIAQCIVICDILTITQPSQPI